jgi:S-layer homology domain
MRALRPAIAGLLTLLLILGASAPGAGADPHTDAGIVWLEGQQLADGSFEVAGFPGFETPDALMAIATNAQTTNTWSTAEALAAANAVDNGGKTGLDWIDDWVDGDVPDPGNPGQFLTVPPEQQAKLIVLVAAPFGFDPTDFDPEEDDAAGAGVDLTTNLDTISTGLFNGFMVGRLAEAELNLNVHQRDLQIICEAAKPGGGWSFDGDPGATNAADLDTTGFAVMTLRASGLGAGEPVVEGAEDFVEAGQQANGAWQSFGSDDPNATTLAMWAWLAAGNALGTLPHDPVTWLQGQQLTTPPADAGRFPSPNDGFGINTFATSQAVQALHLALPNADWLPRPPDSGRRCLPEATYSDVPAGAWYDDGARWVDDEDIVAGIQSQFRATGAVKRAQASMWLNLMFGGVGGDPHGFTDVPAGAWYDDGVDFVADAPNGPIAGGFNGRFRPRLTLTRAQATNWLYAAAGSPDVTGLPAHGFLDVGPNAQVADAATWAKANGIVAGINGRLRPDGNVKRAQFVQWMFLLAATPEAWPEGVTFPPTLLFIPGP